MGWNTAISSTLISLLTMAQDVDVKTHQPDWERFRQLFSRIHLETPFDYPSSNWPLPRWYIEEPDQPTLLKLLNTDFNDYFIPIT